MTESDRIEVERRLASVEHEISHLRAIFQRQTMQQIGTASPKVVAGPLRLVDTTPRIGEEIAAALERGRESRVLTHASCNLTNCGGRCGICDDEPPGAA